MKGVILTIESNAILYQPMIYEEITVDWEREKAPGRLQFSVIKDEKIEFQEGDVVRLSIGETDFFYGFVFVKKRTSAQIIEVTAYDQLRYFKNKDSFRVDYTAAKLIKTIADTCLLKCSEIADTEVEIHRREDNVTYFDMIQNALEETVRQSGKLFVLYDAFGALTLKPADEMVLDFLVCGETVEDFTYETSIDGDTYNQIKICFEDKDAGSRVVTICKDNETINQWGLLQYYELSMAQEANMARAQGLLKLYNTKKRILKVTGVLGDVRVRAGCFVPVFLTLGDVDANTLLLVESVRHKFQNGGHTMELELWGGKFV